MADLQSRQLEVLLNSVHAMVPLIRQHADDAERNRCLSRPVVDALAEAGIFRMYTPRSLGGLEVEPLTFSRVIEEIAQIDGSTGWCAWIGGVNPLLSAAISDEAAEEIFGRNRNVVSGSAYFPPGKAVVEGGGYRVSGRWPYASGCQHCDWYFVLCHVFHGDQLRPLDNGEPEIRAAFVPSDKLTILDTWDVSGLAGTGSHDVVVDNVFVPEQFTWQFRPGVGRQSRHFQGMLYCYPLYAAGMCNIGAVAIGIAEGAAKAAIEMAQSKRSAGTKEFLRDRPLFHSKIAEAVALIRSARSWLHATITDVGKSLQVRGQVTFAERAGILLAAANATRCAAQAVDLVYTAAGGAANYRRSLLQRALRDIHAATQHIATAPQQFESAGRMMMGLPPHSPPLILF